MHTHSLTEASEEESLTPFFDWLAIQCYCQRKSLEERPSIMLWGVVGSAVANWGRGTHCRQAQLNYSSRWRQRALTSLEMRASGGGGTLSKVVAGQQEAEVGRKPVYSVASELLLPASAQRHKPHPCRAKRCTVASSCHCLLAWKLRLPCIRA